MNSTLTHVTLDQRNLGLVEGHAPQIARLNAVIEDIARTDIPVLLVGESGTGKDVYARRIHRLSKQADWPMKKLNCRAAEAGEFVSLSKTNQKEKRDNPGSQQGTLFLDEIDELDFASQRLLLSVLPDGESEQGSSSGMRIVASTSRDLEKEIESGRFRRELYFRINGVCLHLPPLRERKEDILDFMGHFLSKHAAGLGREIPALSEKEKELLVDHDWPGNVRELENLARKIVLFGDSRTTIEELQEKPRMPSTVVQESLRSSLKVVARKASRLAERDLIAKALERTQWNRKRAAQELQISYKSLLYKIKQTGLDGK